MMRFSVAFFHHRPTFPSLLMVLPCLVTSLASELETKQEGSGNDRLSPKLCEHLQLRREEASMSRPRHLPTSHKEVYKISMQLMIAPSSVSAHAQRESWGSNLPMTLMKESMAFSIILCSSCCC